jgi:hypothetical protein
MKKYILIFFIPFLMLGSILMATSTCWAEDDLVNKQTNTSKDKTGAKANFHNPLEGLRTDDPNVLIGRVINAILGVVGSLALLMFIFGGLTWMLAAGSPERVQKGKNILVWATIGLIVIFTSYAMVRFVFKGLGVE